jgi:hypothetical protein
MIHYHVTFVIPSSVGRLSGLQNSVIQLCSLPITCLLCSSLERSIADVFKQQLYSYCARVFRYHLVLCVRASPRMGPGDTGLPCGLLRPCEWWQDQSVINSAPLWCLHRTAVQWLKLPEASRWLFLCAGVSLHCKITSHRWCYREAQLLRGMA